jgi:hypothetical protein
MSTTDVNGKHANEALAEGRPQTKTTMPEMYNRSPNRSGPRPATQSDPPGIRSKEFNLPQEYIGEIRRRFPEYDDLSDQELASRLLERYPDYEPVLGDVARSRYAPDTAHTRDL